MKKNDIVVSNRCDAATIEQNGIFHLRAHPQTYSDYYISTNNNTKKYIIIIYHPWKIRIRAS